MLLRLSSTGEEGAGQGGVGCCVFQADCAKALRWKKVGLSLGTSERGCDSGAKQEGSMPEEVGDHWWHLREPAVEAGFALCAVCRGPDGHLDPMLEAGVVFRGGESGLSQDGAGEEVRGQLDFSGRARWLLCWVGVRREKRGLAELWS